MSLPNADTDRTNKTHKQFVSSRFIIGAMIISLSVILDQISKLLVELHLPFGEFVAVFPSFAMYRTWNEGVAFSFLAGHGSTALVILAILVVGVVIWLWKSSPKERVWLSAGYAMIIGGAIGNIIDRGLYGHVVDFIMIYYQNWSFAIFNIADCFITIGVILIILDEVWVAYKAKNTTQNDTIS
ncbi:MAG: signal peptidase II [Lentilitoribacter sp.]